MLDSDKNLSKFLLFDITSLLYNNPNNLLYNFTNLAEKIMDKLIENVRVWADQKNLLKKENSKAQMLKVLEEIGETAGALLKKNNKELIDGLGDSFVTLIILCYQLDLEPKDCLQAAWNEIKNRKGKTVNGTFIRD